VCVHWPSSGQVGEGEGNVRRNEADGGLLPHPMKADDLSSALISIWARMVAIAGRGE